MFPPGHDQQARIGPVSVDIRRQCINRPRPCRRTTPVPIVPSGDRHSVDPNPGWCGDFGPGHRFHGQISMVPGISSGRTIRFQQLHRLEPVADFYRPVVGEELGQVACESHPRHLGTMTIRIVGTPQPGSTV